MDIQTRSTIQISLSFDETEARAFLVDPAPAQDAVRKVLAEHRAAQNGKGDARAGSPRAHRGEKFSRREGRSGERQRSPKVRAIRTRPRCPECGAGRHQRDSTCSRANHLSGVIPTPAPAAD